MGSSRSDRDSRAKCVQSIFGKSACILTAAQIKISDRLWKDECQLNVVLEYFTFYY